MSIEKINSNTANRQALREHARYAIADYSPLMSWLLLDSEGALRNIFEAQGNTIYCGSDTVIATQGDVYQAHGQGGARDDCARPYKTQRAYLIDLLGREHYARIFKQAI